MCEFLRCKKDADKWLNLDIIKKKKYKSKKIASFPKRKDDKIEGRSYLGGIKN